MSYKLKNTLNPRINYNKNVKLYISTYLGEKPSAKINYFNENSILVELLITLLDVETNNTNR